MHFKRRAFTSLHHSDSGVNLGGERQHDLVRLAINSDTHAFLHIGRSDVVVQRHNEFCVLTNVDDVSGRGRGDEGAREARGSTHFALSLGLSSRLG